MAHHRILLVSAAMGGGHLQIARELERRLRARGHTTLLVDQLSVMPGPTGRWLGRLYIWLVNRAPRIYQWVYQTFFLARQKGGERAGVPVRLALSGLRRVADGFRPDLAVSTYPLCSLALGELRRRGQLSCPAVTVLTTFSVNYLWLHPAVDLELCISGPAAEDVTRRTGRPAAVCGPVVRDAFWDHAGDGVGVREGLGVDGDRHLALVTTGSMGLVGDAVTAAEAIASLPDWVPVVLCGHSEMLAEQLAQVEGAVAVDWSDDMPSMMAAADVLVDNNCGMAAKEALACGLPVVTFRPISGHGRDDTDALAGLGLTDRVDEVSELQAALARILHDPRCRRDREDRGRALFVADAAEMLEQVAARAGR
ncbi:MAG TPA: glycosyltransferase [Nocardioides sp.]|uniref:MGDG synthase family glycosyltransferase n=1 Tax=Nocardioides sp. TaxID=35761 RepID=UPI002F402164